MLKAEKGTYWPKLGRRWPQRAQPTAEAGASGPACLPTRFPRDPTLIAGGRCCIFPCTKIQSDTFSLSLFGAQESWFINIKPPSQIKTLSAVTASLQITQGSGEFIHARLCPCQAPRQPQQRSQLTGGCFTPYCCVTQLGRAASEPLTDGFRALAPTRGASSEQRDAQEEQ